MPVCPAAVKLPSSKVAPETPKAVKLPTLVMLVCAAVSTEPVKLPATLPVTSPVKSPVTLPVTLPVRLPVTLPVIGAVTPANVGPVSYTHLTLPTILRV